MNADRQNREDKGGRENVALQFDRSRSKRTPDALYLEDAVDSLLLNADVEDPQNDPWGCELELE